MISESLAEEIQGAATQAILRQMVDHGSPDPAELPARGRPRAAEVWSRYCHAAITSGTRVTAAFWAGLAADPAWLGLVSVQPQHPPDAEELTALFRARGVRWPRNKAGMILAAAGRDFAALARFLRAMLERHHRRLSDPAALRAVELEVARVVQYELEGCGVGPKIARLMLIWAQGAPAGFGHLVPIESRWLGALGDEGVVLEGWNLGDEDTYRELETPICQAAWELDLTPAQANELVFDGRGRRAARGR